MNTLSNSKFNQVGLKSRDILTQEEIKQFEKTISLKKVKKGTAVAVGAGTILVSSLSVNAEFTNKILPNHLFGEKTVNTIVMDEIKKPVIEVVESKKTESVEEKKETTVNTPAVQTMTLAEANIIFNGSFDTQLNENTPKGRQLFSVFNGISSEVVDTNGSWTQLDYDESLVDGATVYNIAVGGKYSKSGIISSHIIEMEFHCNENGGIS